MQLSDETAMFMVFCVLLYSAGHTGSPFSRFQRVEFTPEVVEERRTLSSLVSSDLTTADNSRFKIKIALRINKLGFLIFQRKLRVKVKIV